MTYRKIDARGIWRGEREALAGFARCFAQDCGSDREIFHRVYGWTPEALDAAIANSAGIIFEGAIQ